MPRNTPTLAEIAADFRLWGEYFDVDGLDSPEQWEHMTFRDRLEKVRAAFDPEPCRDCGAPTYNLGGGSCWYCA
jgi:hypothetical protein